MKNMILVFGLINLAIQSAGTNNEHTNNICPKVTPDLNELESNYSAGEVIVRKEGDFLYVANSFSKTHNLVKKIECIRQSTYKNNPNVNFVEDYLSLKGTDIAIEAIFLKNSSDDITPPVLNGSAIGANHSWNQGWKLKSRAHGKTIVDIGSIYKDSSNVEYVILRVEDDNNLWITSKNQSNDGYTYTFVTPAGTLKYLSNGANTSKIKVESTTTLGNTYTAIVPADVNILLDGKTAITVDGIYQCNFLDIVERYDVLDLPSILEQLISNRPSGGYREAPMLNSFPATQKLFSHSINYRFTDNGNTVVSTTFRTYKKVQMSLHGFVQATALTSGNLYCPKSLPVSDGVTTYDLRKICDWTKAPATPLRLSPSHWENPLSPPDRILNMNSTVNFMLGYITDRGIEESRKDVVHDAIYLYTTRKLYPMGLSNRNPIYIEANEYYSCIAYRCYTNPADNPTGRTNYSYVEVGGDVFLFLDYHGTLNDRIIPKPEWVGKKIEIYETNEKVSIIGNLVTGGIEIVSTASPNNNGFIVLKLQ